MIGLPAGTYELEFDVASLDLCRTKIAEDGKVGATETTMYGLGKGDAGTDHHDIDILGRAVEKEVAHPASDDVAFEPERVGFLTDKVEGMIV